MRIIEIFNSISGEVSPFHQGEFATFVRFAGCNLQCSYCDTPESQDIHAGTKMSLKEIISVIKRLNCKNIILTGGEPLLNENKKDFIELLDWLYEQSYEVAIETNGTVDLVSLRANTSCYFIVDYKLDQVTKMNEDAFLCLSRFDIIKFVIQNKKDIYKAVKVQKEFINEDIAANFAYSPVAINNQISTELAKDIYKILREEELHGIINVQLHKLLNFK